MRRVRTFRLICLLTALLVIAVGASASEYLVYVGTYTGAGSKGSHLRVDQRSGGLTPTGRSLEIVSPVCVCIISLD